MANETLLQLRNIVLEVKRLRSHTLSNGYSLKSLHDQAYNIITNINTVNKNRYYDILTGMTDGNWYDLATTSISDYESGKKYLLDDLEDAIQRFINDNNLSVEH